MKLHQVLDGVFAVRVAPRLQEPTRARLPR